MTGTPPTILVVDDEENMLRLFKRVLGRKGYDVICAASGSAALGLAARESIDLAIVDLGLPDVDSGLLMEQLAHLRPGLPVIAVSGEPRRLRGQPPRPPVCQAFMAKPLDLKLLEDRIRTLLPDSSD